jgi:hypothetical protein
MIEVVLLYSDVMTCGVDAYADLLHMPAQHGYAPDDFGKPRSMKGTLDELRKQVARGSVAVVLARKADPAMASFSVQSSDEPNDGSGAGTIVTVSLTPSKSTVELLVALASWGTVLQGAGHDDYELAHIDRELWWRPSEPVELRAIFQYNVLGKQLVAKLGKQRVMSTPGVEIRELPNGAVFIDAGTSATVHAKAFAHLCPGEPVPERTIPKRVKPDWDPELASVFATIVEREGLESRNALITKLNKLRPAKPETLSPPRGANVRDREKSIRLYHSVVEELVVLLHDKEPALGSNAGPEVLPLMDIHFYTEDYPGTFGAEKTALLLRPLGAWLGELLVRELDGEWAPRGKMDEIEVVVGNTAFLPLLRARHYLASKDAVLEYSLTKYFADAKRLVTKPTR